MESEMNGRVYKVSPGRLLVCQMFKSRWFTGVHLTVTNNLSNLSTHWFITLTTKTENFLSRTNACTNNTILILNYFRYQNDYPCLSSVRYVTSTKTKRQRGREKTRSRVGEEKKGLVRCILFYR